jgi:tryptophan synthase beta chain
MRISLETKELPDKWYNIVPDLGFTLVPLMSPSGYPLGVRDLEALAPHSIIDQELEKDKRDTPIPNEVRELYSEWRPTPLYRAERFEKSLGTPASIFCKYEGGSFSGSHEMNTAIAQAYYAAREGAKRLVTATGNGERVYMVRSSYEEKVYGRYLMEILGTEVVPSPNENTRTGKKVLSETPESLGSLGIALSEAFEDASSQDDTKFCWGTVMNHVLLHQTIIGLEARLQMRLAGAYPDILIAAVTGGSAFGGLVFPFYQDRKRGIRLVAVETAAAPSLSKGRYAYDYGDSGRLPMLLKMYTLGHSYVPPGIRAGGMRYHGMSPLVSALYREKQIEASVCTQRQAFDSAVAFARAEGFVPSPESSYTLKTVIDEALACKERKERKNILFVLSGNSNLDIATFKDFLEGAIQDQLLPEDQVQAALEQLPKVTPS